jgi:TolB protein
MALKIVFESDRSGSQETLYHETRDGSGTERISFGEGRYGNPVWSPRGGPDRLYKKCTGASFYIGVMRPDGSRERLITSAYHVEGPSWSPNGRVLIFFKETPGANGRSAKLYTIDLTGFNERRLDTPARWLRPGLEPVE